MSQFLGLLLLVAGIAAQCPPDYEYLGGKCLSFQLNDLAWAESSLRCQKLNATLAKIEDCSVMTDIAKFVLDNNINRNFWVDGTDYEEDMTFKFSDGTPMPMGAPFWGSFSDYTFEPQFGDGDNCAGLSPLDGFYFHNEGCASVHAVICQRDPTENGTCPPSYMQFGGGCYQLLLTQEGSLTVLFRGSWDEARAGCQSNGAEIAIIDDCDAFTGIARSLKEERQISFFWIGGIRQGDSWLWIDGTEMEMRGSFWGQDNEGGLEPSVNDPSSGNENCVLLSSSHRVRFIDYYCSLTEPFLCEVPVDETAKNMA